MPKVSDLSPESRFVGLFVGRSGSGKTVAEASFPKPIEFKDFDGRIRGLLGAPWLDLNDIRYDYYPPKDPALITRINKELETMMLAGKVNQPLPTTLVTDSITSQVYAWLCQSIPLTHSAKDKGKWMGAIAMAGPADYGLQSQATQDYLGFLRSLPIQNIIVSAHYVDKYAKPVVDGEVQTFAESVVIGKKLTLTDKLAENIQIFFDHIFEFEREVINNKEKFYVTFRGELARTSYTELPIGRHDITGKNFYDFMVGLINKGEKK